MNGGGRTAEEAWLQACLGLQLDPASARPERAQGLDWAHFGELAREQRLAGVLYALGEREQGLWPAEVQEALQAVRYTALLRGGRDEEQVTRVLEALRAAGVAAIVLKGWALVATVYGGDPSQRPAVDLDLLVRPGDVESAKAVLLDLGCQDPTPEPWPGYLQRYQRACSFAWPGEHSFCIDLHWALLDLPYHAHRMPVEELFARARPVEIAGVPALVLALEDHLIYAAGHLAFSHSYDPALFRPYEAAAQIVQAGPVLDWDTVAARTVAWRLVLPVRHLIDQLAALWPAVAPPAVAARFAALRPTPAEARVHRWCLAWHDNAALMTLLMGLTMPGVGRRLRFLVETAFPKPGFLRQVYGPEPWGFWPWLYVRRGLDTASLIVGLGGRRGGQSTRRWQTGDNGRRPES